ncbi:uncharacterized protein LOC123296236 [Chrysoperla carnea]|uniref:uncharacterized protein LOC123296236 n=1 Tax=Chrysoperla carnea TaxID=189513 RepID=UPI001D07CB20|nr:uncharacterized protein LOC123296236 [Chrysoperla carnea]
MESSLNEYEQKIIKVLQQFLIPDYKIGNDTYLEILLSQISGKYDAELGERLLTSKIFTNWIDEAITQWEQSPLNLPSIPIQTFALNLTSLVSSNETQFIKLDLINLYTRMCKLFCVEHDYTNVSVKLGYVRLLTSFLSYPSGIQWILESERWKHILKYCYKSQTIYITRESQNFFIKLLKVCYDSEKFIEYVDLIFIEILLPLQKLQKVAEIKNDEIEDDITPMLKLIQTILHEFYLNYSNPKLFTKIFISKYQNDLEQNLWSLVNTTPNNKFHIILAHILTQLYFGTIINLKTDNNSSDDTSSTTSSESNENPQVLNIFSGKLYALFNLLISKRSFGAFIKTVGIAHVYCCKLISEHKIEYTNQLVMFQLIPIGSLIQMYLEFDNSYCKSDHPENEIMELYIAKLFKISCEDTIRLCYTIRDAILNAGPKICQEICVQGLGLSMQTRTYYERDQIIILFQHLMYLLLNLSDATRDNKLPNELAVDPHGVITNLLQSIATLITEFKLTWRDCVETICLLDKSVNLLKSQMISSRATVLALKVIQLGIENFMAPNLALLMDSIECSSALTDLGPLLYQRLHDVQWEIRDSVLEVLHTLIVISERKFPAFQKLLLNNNLCTIILDKAINDSESYVRAMALKCITSMVKIDTFWNKVLEQENLLDKTINILKNETEGIVRREAVAVITEIYENERIKCDIALKRTYKTMSLITLTDLHWEVKINGLEFWRQVICKQLSHQGMIDGTFPDVTFSKENRKIIVLNENEIKNRLYKVLKYLSIHDCLTVLIYCLYDECDITVVNTALSILLKMKAWYNKYNMLINNNNNNKNKTITNNLETRIDNNDSVIDSIINSKDINLLVNVYNKQNDVNEMIIDEQQQPQSEPQIQNNLDENDLVNNKITPELFLQYLGCIDPQLVATERNRWLTHCTYNLDSLLDDILKSYDDQFNNVMDCY